VRSGLIWLRIRIIGMLLWRHTKPSGSIKRGNFVMIEGLVGSERLCAIVLARLFSGAAWNVTSCCCGLICATFFTFDDLVLLCCRTWSTSYLLKLGHDRFLPLSSKTCVLCSFTTSVWNVCHSKKKWTRYDKKCLLVFM
jgi:hypothetical protein